MKNLKFLTLLFIFFCFDLTAQTEYKVITSVESIVPNGLGRSRLISANDVKNYKEFTSTQTEEDNTRNKSKRDEIVFKMKLTSKDEFDVLSKRVENLEKRLEKKQVLKKKIKRAKKS